MENYKTLRISALLPHLYSCSEQCLDINLLPLEECANFVQVASSVMFKSLHAEYQKMFSYSLLMPFSSLSPNA